MWEWTRIGKIDILPKIQCDLPILYSSQRKMPIDIFISKDIACFHCTGTITFREVMEANDRLLSDPISDVVIGQFIDFLDLDAYLLTEQEAAVMAYVDKSAAEYMEPNRIAFIVRDTRIRGILGRYVDALAETVWDARLFDEREAAWTWLTEGRGTYAEAPKTDLAFIGKGFPSPNDHSSK